MKKKDIDSLFELIEAGIDPKLPLSAILSYHSGIHKDKLLGLAVDLNKYRRTGSQPNYKMISVLMRLISDDEVVRIINKNRESRYGNTEQSSDEKMAVGIFKKTMMSTAKLPNPTFSELIQRHIKMNLVPCEIVLDELESYFTVSEITLLNMTAKEFNSRSEDSINTISLLSAEHRHLLRKNRKKERERLLYEYEHKNRHKNRTCTSSS